ncbi:MAG: hypothetical protein ACRD3M_13975 [Thermoanaerobaculia bacterium]
MRKNLTLAAAALGVAGIASSCAQSSSGGSGDAVELGIRVAAALAATQAAKNATPVLREAPPPTPLPATDRDSLEALIQAFYGGFSRAAGAEPDWGRLQALFLPGASLNPPRFPGDPSWKAISFEEFRDAFHSGARSVSGWDETGFYEREIGRETSAYGTFVLVLSAFEGRFHKDDPKPSLRGVYGIQAVRLSDGWSIVSLAWDIEGPDNPIPDRLLRGP